MKNHQTCRSLSPWTFAAIEFPQSSLWRAVSSPGNRTVNARLVRPFAARYKTVLMAVLFFSHRVSTRRCSKFPIFDSRNSRSSALVAIVTISRSRATCFPFECGWRRSIRVFTVNVFFSRAPEPLVISNRLQIAFVCPRKYAIASRATGSSVLRRSRQQLSVYCRRRSRL